MPHEKSVILEKLYCYIGGYDFTKYLKSMPSLIETKPSIGQALSVPTITLDFNNEDEMLSPDEPNSFFYGRDYVDMEILIKNDQNNAIWKGKISKISFNYGSVQIFGDSDYQKKSQDIVIFINNNKSPAQQAKELLDLYNIEIDDTSFNLSDSLQLSDEILCSALILPSDQMTLLNVLQSLCDIGIMTIYSENGIVKCQYYKSQNLGIEIPLDQVMNIIAFEDQEYNPYVGYSVNTPLGDITYNSDNGNNIKSINASTNIVVDNVFSAMAIGQAWIDFSSIKKRKVKVDINKELANILSLSNAITINNEKYNISSIDRGDMLYTSIVTEK